MKIKYIAAFSILLLTSCSFSDETPQEPIQTGSIQNTPVIQTGSTQVTPEIVEVEASNVKDIPLTLVDGKWTVRIQSGTGSRQNIHFNSEGIKTLKVSVQTPGDAKGNVRISQIIFPDKTSDGPFGKELMVTLTQNGAHQIVLSANMMAGDPWAGEVDVSVELK